MKKYRFPLALLPGFFLLLQSSSAQVSLDYLVDSLKGMPVAKKSEQEIKSQFAAKFCPQTLFFLTRSDSTQGFTTGPLPELQKTYKRSFSSLPHGNITLFKAGKDTFGLSVRNFNFANERINFGAYFGLQDSGKFTVIKNPNYYQQACLPATLFDSITSNVVNGKMCQISAVSCFVEDTLMKRITFKGQVSYFSGAELSTLTNLLDPGKGYFYDDMLLIKVEDSFYESIPELYGGSMTVSYGSQQILVGLISNRFRFSYIDQVTMVQKNMSFIACDLIDAKKLTGK